jgi:hypothetical protein
MAQDAMNCGFRIANFGLHNPQSTIHNPQYSRGGQASLEMTVALIGALLLLFGSLKVYLWVNERLVSRQMSYEATRVAAASATPGAWDDQASAIRLDIFQ